MSGSRVAELKYLADIHFRAAIGHQNIAAVVKKNVEDPMDNTSSV